jgi:hypothetical protein
MSRKPKVLTKEQILAAQARTKSNFAAARYLHVSYPHYKKYAKTYTDSETGKTLFEMHLNQSGKGIPKIFDYKTNDPKVRDVVEGKVAPYSWSPDKLKKKIIQEGLIEEKCSRCGHTEKRALDLKAPLLLHFKDGNKENFLLDNLDFLCYNCYFLYVGNVLSGKQITALEDYNEGKHTESTEWELDEWQLEHLEELGLGDLEDEPGSEFIDYQ